MVSAPGLALLRRRLETAPESLCARATGPPSIRAAITDMTARAARAIGALPGVVAEFVLLDGMTALSLSTVLPSGSPISPVPGFMSSWDSRSSTSVAVAKDLSVPIYPQPFSVDVEGRPTHFLRNT